MYLNREVLYRHVTHMSITSPSHLESKMWLVRPFYTITGDLQDLFQAVLNIYLWDIFIYITSLSKLPEFIKLQNTCPVIKACVSNTRNTNPCLYPFYHGYHSCLFINPFGLTNHTLTPWFYAPHYWPNRWTWVLSDLILQSWLVMSWLIFSRKYFKTPWGSLEWV